MGRRPNPHRKVELLEQIGDYVTEFGLADLSLRPLAKSLGTSTYTLTYQFGSKDEMIADVISHLDARQRQRTHDALVDASDVADVVGRLWELDTDEDDGVAWSQVMLEVATMTSRDTEAFEGYEASTVTGRIDVLRSLLLIAGTAPSDAEAEATALHAVLQGLVLDRLHTGDVERTTAALHAALAKFGLATSTVA